HSLGIYDLSRRQLAPIDLAVVATGCGAIWTGRIRLSFHQFAFACCQCSAAFRGARAHDAGALAKRTDRGAIRLSPAARRIRRLDRRAQGRSEFLLLAADDARLLVVRATTRDRPILARRRIVRLGSDGQANARNAAVCATTARLLAARPVRRVAG